MATSQPASRGATASSSATASARRCRWRWWTGALRSAEFDEEAKGPAQDEEFVLSHSDNVQATGFVEHLKLPHYVDFQSELALIRQLRAEHAERMRSRAGAPREAAE